MRLSSLIFSTFFVVGIFFESARAEESSLGSVSIVVSQRFYDDQKLGNVNGFSNWGALSFDATFGLYEFPYRIEPFLGVGYIQNTAVLCSQEADGSCHRDANGDIEDSLDRLKYQLISFELGVRHRAWDPSFFLVVPYVQGGITYRFGRVRKVTKAEGQQKLNLGGDFGAEVGGGLLVSFFYDDAKKSDMNATWGLKDFALMTSIRYLPAGWFRHGLGLLDNTGGWDFGMGLSLDW